MRQWLLDAPRWALSLLHGVLFGVAMVGVTLLQGGGWTRALTTGVLSGAFFGLVIGWFSHRQYRRQREVVGGLPADAARVANRASWRGPVPADPEVRAAAIRLVDHYLAAGRRWRTGQLVVLIAGVALYTAQGLLGSPWWWAAAAFFVAMLAFTLLLPRHLQRRAERLRDGA